METQPSHCVDKCLVYKFYVRALAFPLEAQEHKRRFIVRMEWYTMLSFNPLKRLIILLYNLIPWKKNVKNRLVVKLSCSIQASLICKEEMGHGFGVGVPWAWCAVPEAANFGTERSICLRHQFKCGLPSSGVNVHAAVNGSFDRIYATHSKLKFPWCSIFPF